MVRPRRKRTTKIKRFKGSLERLCRGNSNPDCQNPPEFGGRSETLQNAFRNADTTVKPLVQLQAESTVPRRSQLNI
ncbi:hypothetical protein K0M31_002905 [Melipona bicolor]|uniref:Uncharacterized protein n=1 Tax=Melipona bicolor TaxID=60889 RepID=A0AA40FZV9_9HYME|nr:hypothetical protein K0M31_002905 [Melipona bicolor]